MPVNFQHALLDNGLTILAETDDAAHSAALGFFVKTGARDEDPAVMGVSHFLEHMMFKGSARRAADQLNRDFDRIGARNNAYTSGEMTCFHATVLPEALASATEILADMLRPALREQDFATEKGVILEEIAMYEDNPFWVLYERAMEEHYRAHPLAHRVLGTKATITALTAPQMRAYFDARYSADNTVVALAGRMDFPAVVDQLGALCGSWRRTGAVRNHGDIRLGERSFEVRDEKVTRSYTIMITPAPDSADDRRYAASLLAQVLGGPDNSRLHWALVETGLAEEAEAGFDPRDGAGDFMVFVSGDPQRAAELRATVDAQVQALGRTLVDDDLERIRAKLATSVTVGGERPAGRMQRLGRQWTYLGRYTTLEEELDRINAVTVNDLRDVLEAYPFTPRTVGTLLPR